MKISGFSGPQQPHSSFDFSPAMPFHDFPGDMGSAVGKCPWSRPPSKPWASEQECLVGGFMYSWLWTRENHDHQWRLQYSRDKGKPQATNHMIRVTQQIPAVSYETMHHECIIYETSTKSQIWRPRIWGKVPQVPWLTLGSPQATTGWYVFFPPEEILDLANPEACDNIYPSCARRVFTISHKNPYVHPSTARLSCSFHIYIYIYYLFN